MVDVETPAWYSVSMPLYKHGLADTHPYRVWQNMKTRCHNPNFHAYHRYGGRGITVCERWKASFANFWEDMGKTYTPGLTIERRKNDEGYSPDNCFWATRIEQCRNQSTNRMIETPWGRISLAEASERSGMPYGCILARIHRGWPDSRLFERAKKRHRDKVGRIVWK